MRTVEGGKVTPDGKGNKPRGGQNSLNTFIMGVLPLARTYVAGRNQHVNAGQQGEERKVVQEKKKGQVETH